MKQLVFMFEEETSPSDHFEKMLAEGISREIDNEILRCLLGGEPRLTRHVTDGFPMRDLEPLTFRGRPVERNQYGELEVNISFRPPTPLNFVVLSDFSPRLQMNRNGIVRDDDGTT